MSRRYQFYLPESFQEDHPAVAVVHEYLSRPNARGLFPKFESWHGTEYFVLRFGDSQRVFFQAVKIAGSRAYIYQSMTETHDHDKVTRMNVFSGELDEAPKGFKLFSNQQKSTGAGAAQTQLEPEDINWQDDVIGLTHRQQLSRDALLSKPVTILSGPPGSGKTLSIFSALQKTVQRLQSKGESGSILFVCETPELVLNIKREWTAWYKASPEGAGQVDVVFSCYQAAVSSMLSEVTQAKLVQNPKTNCCEFISRFLKVRGIKDVSVDEVYAEFLLHADRLHDDLNTLHEKLFRDSKFYKAGARHHNLPIEKLEIVYEVYKAYMQSLISTQSVNLVLQEPDSISTEKFLMTIADEAHGYSQTQLQTLYKVSEKFVTVIDTHQSGSAVANQDLFAAWLEEKQGVNVHRDTLPVTLRTPQAVNNVLKKILDLKNILAKGKLTRAEYSTVSDEVSVAPGSVSTLFIDKDVASEELRSYGKSVEFAVIIGDESQRLYVEKTFGTRLVFTLDQARGLEFDQVAVFSFFSGDQTRLVSQKLRSLDLSVPASDHLGSRDALHESAGMIKTLNDLFTIFSRVKKDLIIVESLKEKDRSRHLLNYLLREKRQEITADGEVLASNHLPQVQVASTREEILVKAMRLKSFGRNNIARSLLQSVGDLSERDIHRLMGQDNPAAKAQTLFGNTILANSGDSKHSGGAAAAIAVAYQASIASSGDAFAFDTDDMLRLKTYFATSADKIRRFRQREIEVLKRRFDQWFENDPVATVFVVKRVLDCVQDKAVKQKFAHFLLHEKPMIFAHCQGESKFKLIAEVITCVQDDSSFQAVLKVLNTDDLDFVSYCRSLLIKGDDRMNVFIYALLNRNIVNLERANIIYGLLMPSNLLSIKDYLALTVSLEKLNFYIISSCRVVMSLQNSNLKTAAVQLELFVLKKNTEILMRVLSKYKVIWRLCCNAMDLRLPTSIGSWAYFNTAGETHPSFIEKCDEGVVAAWGDLPLHLDVTKYPDVDFALYDQEYGGVPGKASSLITDLFKEQLQAYRAGDLSALHIPSVVGKVEFDTDDMQKLKTYFALIPKDAFIRFADNEINCVRRKLDSWLSQDKDITLFVLKRMIVCMLNVKSCYLEQLCSLIVYGRTALPNLDNGKVGFNLIHDVMVDSKTPLATQLRILGNKLMPFIDFCKNEFVAGRVTTAVFLYRLLESYAGEPELFEKVYSRLLPDDSMPFSEQRKLSAEVLNLNQLIINTAREGLKSKSATERDKSQLLRTRMAKSSVEFMLSVLPKHEVAWQLFIRAKTKRDAYGENSDFLVEERAALYAFCETGRVDSFRGVTMNLNFEDYPKLDLSVYDSQNGGPGSAEQIIFHMFGMYWPRYQSGEVEALHSRLQACDEASNRQSQAGGMTLGK